MLCAVLVLLSLLGFYLWLNLRIYSVIDREEYRQLVEQINASENLPERFIEIYGMVTGFNENSTTKRAIFNFNYIFRGEIKECPCHSLVGFMIPHSSFSGDWRLFGSIQTMIAMRLDRDVSPRRCLDFLLLYKWDFWHSVIGIRNASRFYFEKELEELTDDQMFKLALKAVHPGRYNIKRFPDRVERRIEETRANK